MMGIYFSKKDGRIVIDMKNSIIFATDPEDDTGLYFDMDPPKKYKLYLKNFHIVGNQIHWIRKWLILLLMGYGYKRTKSLLGKKGDK